MDVESTTRLGRSGSTRKRAPMVRNSEASSRVYAELWPDVDEQPRDSVQLVGVI